jgi:hypothetical protein
VRFTSESLLLQSVPELRTKPNRSIMAPFQHGVFELLANMVRVNGAEDEFLPRSETELLGNFPFLTDDEKFKDGPNGEKRQIFLQRNVYEDKPDVWPSLSVSLLTAATEFNKAHDIGTHSDHLR